MSHFVVGVITKANEDNIEELLYPYDEELEVDYKDMTQEIKKEYLNEGMPVYFTPELDLYYKYGKNIPKKVDKKYVFSKENLDIPSDWKEIRIPYKILYPTFEEYVEAFYDGRTGYYYNKKSRWDWWVIGGRWDGFFNGENTINVKDFNTAINLRKYNKAFKQWKKWESNNYKIDLDDECDNWEFTFFNSDYMKDRYKNAENYARIQATPWMRVIVTPDGEWHEVGKMGWWACSDETGDDLIDWVDHFAERFILPYSNGEYEITAVDCHI